MKGHSKPHAPKTGPGFSAGQAPVKVTNSGDAARPRNSAGMDKINHVHPSSKPDSGKGGDMAAMRRPYGK